MSSSPPDPRLSALEAALAGLTPSAAGLSRDAILYQAGQQSARAPGWQRWAPWAAAASALLLAPALGLMFRPAPEIRTEVRTVERVVVVGEPAPNPEPPDQPLAPPPGTVASTATALAAQPSYLRLRQSVLRHGADALPEPSSGAAAHAPADRDDFLDDSREPWLRQRRASLMTGDHL